MDIEEFEAALCDQCRGLRAGHGIAFCPYHSGYNKAYGKWRQTVANRDATIQGLRDMLEAVRREREDLRAALEAKR